jgi:hypothetical protein
MPADIATILTGPGEIEAASEKAAMEISIAVVMISIRHRFGAFVATLTTHVCPDGLGTSRMIALLLSRALPGPYEFPRQEELLELRNYAKRSQRLPQQKTGMTPTLHPVVVIYSFKHM